MVWRFCVPTFAVRTPIPARVESVTGTARRTTLGSGRNQVTLVEHVLAALAGMRVDNCLVELDGPEPPGLDGSAEGYAETLLAAGTILQNASRPRLSVQEVVSVAQGHSTLSFYPARGRRFSNQLSARLRPSVADSAAIAHACRSIPIDFGRIWLAVGPMSSNTKQLNCNARELAGT